MRPFSLLATIAASAILHVPSASWVLPTFAPATSPVYSARQAVALLVGGSLTDDAMSPTSNTGAPAMITRAANSSGWGVGGRQEAIDQQQTLWTRYSGRADNWQSFTAGKTGSLTRVDLFVGTPLMGGTSPGTINIYRGEGLGGELLATLAVTWSATNDHANWQTFSLSNPPAVVAEMVYTLRFSAPLMNVGWVTIGSGYLRGRTGLSDALTDFVFKTFVTP